ncbi:MAG: Putative oxidoreductase YncB, partial [uncultured Thermomicrobiales bacterium]
PRGALPRAAQLRQVGAPAVDAARIHRARPLRAVPPVRPGGGTPRSERGAALSGDRPRWHREHAVCLPRSSRGRQRGQDARAGGARPDL